MLVGCEKSGVIRRAFADRGHFVVSVDLEPSYDNAPWGTADHSRGWHYQGDILDFIYGDAANMMDAGFDLAIFHPECMFHANSAAWAFGDGPYHQKVKPGTLVGAARRAARAEAEEFALKLWRAPIPHICIENPAGTLWKALGIRPQYIQPHQFGHDASKKTGLGLKSLPDLAQTKYIAPRWVNGRPRWANQTDSGQNRLSPSDDRSARRADTYEGIADAMADQWGKFIVGC